MNAPEVQCEALVSRIEDHPTLGAVVVATLPEEASRTLSSRGMVMATGFINGHALNIPLEPNGEGSHWFRLDDQLVKQESIQAGDRINLSFSVVKQWPEPKVPQLLQDELEKDALAMATWQDITAAARWEWIRWMGAAKLTETRMRRLEVGCSMLHKGKRRPCCFDRQQCSLTEA